LQTEVIDAHLSTVKYRKDNNGDETCCRTSSKSALTGSQSVCRGRPRHLWTWKLLIFVPVTRNVASLSLTGRCYQSRSGSASGLLSERPSLSGQSAIVISRAFSLAVTLAQLYCRHVRRSARPTCTRPVSSLLGQPEFCLPTGSLLHSRVASANRTHAASTHACFLSRRQSYRN